MGKRIDAGSDLLILMVECGIFTMTNYRGGDKGLQSFGTKEPLDECHHTLTGVFCLVRGRLNRGRP